MKIAIIGSRTFKDYELLKTVLNYHKNKIEIIISGGAFGADSLGKKYAKENNIPITKFLPDWKKHGNSAGFVRNKDIIYASDYIYAFWDGVSKGTKNSIEWCHKYKKSYTVIFFDNEENSLEEFLK